MKSALSKKQKVAAKIIVSIFALSAIGYVIFAVLTAQTFRIHSLDIEPAKNISSTNFSKIEESLRVRLHPLLGQYTWRVNLENVLAQVEKNRLVKSAKVSRLLPGRLRIVVTPHLPIANVMGRRTNELFPLARDGALLPPLNLAYAIDGPILRGLKFLVHPKLRNRAVALLMALPKNGLLNINTISEVHFDKTRGFAMTVSPSGTDVWLGFHNFSEHALHAERVLNYLVDRHLTGRIIDARLDEKVVVKLRNAP